MSGIGGADLVRVRAKGELRAGMTVVLRSCGTCHRDHSMILLGQQPNPALCAHCRKPANWEASFCHPVTGGVTYVGWCLCRGIAEGRIYRLRDLDTAEEEGRRIACDIDDRKRVGDKQHEQSRRVLRGGLKPLGGTADGE